MKHLRLLIFTMLAACLLAPATSSAEAISKDEFTFDISWRQKPRVSLKVWGTMKGNKSCKQFKASILFDNTRKKNLAVTKNIEIKNYKRNTVVEISDVLKVKGTSATRRYWFVNDITVECEN